MNGWAININIQYIGFVNFIILYIFLFHPVRMNVCSITYFVRMFIHDNFLLISVLSLFTLYFQYVLLILSNRFATIGRFGSFKFIKGHYCGLVKFHIYSFQSIVNKTVKKVILSLFT